MTDTQTQAVGPKVSCIIPAYNEAERIGAVIAAVAGHPHVLEVIVVDDASSDQTARVAESFASVRVIRLAQNQGKTLALRRALSEAKGALVLLLDADLRGLEARHITRLIEPVLRGDAD
ncbi:MAG: glycosyltransferase, partial [Alphaproteobacteria bacterium]|nr:glycosyltransferase [Alphaproteobacteria bacterium]